MSTWELIRSGRFDEACVSADEERKSTESLLPLRNKVLALLNLQRYDDAARVSGDVARLDGRKTDSDLLFLGVAEWLAGRLENAVDQWRSAGSAKYTDAAGGVEAPLLLLYASVRLGSPQLNTEGLSSLRSLLKSREADNWPGPIAAYVTGAISEVELRSKLTKQPILRDKQLCQAAFHVGVASMSHRDTGVSVQYFEEASRQGPASLQKPEYYLARHEVARLRGSGA